MGSTRFRFPTDVVVQFISLKSVKINFMNSRMRSTEHFNMKTLCHGLNTALLLSVMFTGIIGR